MLLHDVGKPPTFASAESTGDRIRFDGHAEIGARMAAAICQRLRFSTGDTEQIESLVANHIRFKDDSRCARRRSNASCASTALRSTWRCTGWTVSPATAISRPMSMSGGLFAETPAEQVRPPRLVTGEDLKEMGFQPGPWFKEILHAVEEAQLKGALLGREEALEFVRSHYPAPPAAAEEITNTNGTSLLYQAC